MASELIELNDGDVMSEDALNDYAFLGDFSGQIAEPRKTMEPGVRAALWAGGALSVVAVAFMVLSSGSKPKISRTAAKPAEASATSSSTSGGLPPGAPVVAAIPYSTSPTASPAS